jgi:cobalt-zinc-cadmium efflux system outer membrane protein
MTQSLWCALAAGAAALAPLRALGAQTDDTLRLAAAVALAREANPALSAARLRADAAADRVSQAGAWPDPQLAFGLMNRPLWGFGTDEAMTMNTIQLTQTLPWPGTLGFGKARARALASAQRLDADELERQLVAETRAAYAELAAMDRVLVIMRRTRDLLRDLLEVSQTRYAVGATPQQDVLQAQVAIARMTEDITVVEQRRVAGAARLNALLGRDATVPIGGLELSPPGPPLPAADSMMRLAANHRPALLAARDRVAAAEDGYRAARRQLYPDLMISATYGQRPQFGDMGSLMVGLSLPLWAGSRQLPLRRELDALRTAADAAARDRANETFAQLTELRAEAQRARDLADLYTTAVLPQARAAVDAALSAYRVGQVEFTTLIASELTVNNYDIELVRLAAQYHGAVARVVALLGVDLGEMP